MKRPNYLIDLCDFFLNGPWDFEFAWDLGLTEAATCDFHTIFSVLGRKSHIALIIIALVFVMAL
jgi:hypothetical protein